MFLRAIFLLSLFSHPVRIVRGQFLTPLCGSVPSLDTGPLSRWNISLPIQENSTISCNKDSTIFLAVPESEKQAFHILSNGTLQLYSDYHDVGEYCLESISETNVQIRICPAPTSIWDKTCTDENICIRKCCPDGQILTTQKKGGNLKCQSQKVLWNLTIFQDEYDEDGSTNIPENIYVIPTPLNEGWCEDGPWRLDSEEYKGTKYLIKVLQNGDTIVKNHPLYPWQTLPSGTFCIDGVMRENGNSDPVILDCSLPDEEMEEVEQTVYIVAQAIACFFLILTVIVYVILYERQNIHSWTVMGYGLSMLSLHTSIFATYVYNAEAEIERDWPCLSLGLISHFLYLATFCWLTLINFDVWWTFNRLNLRVRGGTKKFRRFLYYISFAVSIPILIISLGLLLSHVYGKDLTTSVVFLEYSESYCHISDYSALYFKFLPVAFLLGCNIVLFLLTITALHRIGESTKFATNRSSQSDAEKSKFLLFVKLFFVMGLIWISELISYFVFGRNPHPVAYILDVINILQPIAIFIIFVCKGDVLRGLQVKIPCLSHIFQAFGLSSIRARMGSGLSTASVATQISTCSTRSAFSDNPISMEMKGV